MRVPFLRAPTLVHTPSSANMWSSVWAAACCCSLWAPRVYGCERATCEGGGWLHTLYRARAITSYYLVINDKPIVQDDALSLLEPGQPAGRPALLNKQKLPVVRAASLVSGVASLRGPKTPKERAALSCAHFRTLGIGNCEWQREIIIATAAPSQKAARAIFKWLPKWGIKRFFIYSQAPGTSAAYKRALVRRLCSSDVATLKENEWPLRKLHSPIYYISCWRECKLQVFIARSQNILQKQKSLCRCDLETGALSMFVRKNFWFYSIIVKLLER